MRQSKKVSGERLGAAILDSILVSIITFIPTGIWYAIQLDWQDALNSFMVAMDPESELYYQFLQFSMITGLIIGVIYFVYMPYKMNGQTLGKKVLKIKAVNEYGENPTLMQHALRAIQIWASYISIPFIIALFFMESNFVAVVLFGLVGNLVNLALLVSLILVFAKEDGKGLHDMIAGTTVVKIDENFNTDFAMKTAQMGEWADVVDDEDQGFNNNDNDSQNDEWSL